MHGRTAKTGRRDSSDLLSRVTSFLLNKNNQSSRQGQKTENRKIIVPGEQRGYSIYIDQNTDLVTVFEVWLSSGITAMAGQNEFTLPDREVQRQIYFGYVDKGQGMPDNLHHYTNRLEGKGLYWKQDNGIETLEHYASVANTNFVELTRYVDDLSRADYRSGRSLASSMNV